ncbi:hypothetical protein EDF56_106227 [Novosphingobium sp. PhB165]|uniref:hypothetical protein n=1 Tax=Novosphingobium sp. PhB165 TaxID=2485105 RepID=UPI0010ED232E|nr:hypothetical protein [Novosphingobium sp. PhB165]TCM17111.1 hypothetical protein EDF56_106227 [Novosphingobium sp. PhB165]
MAKTGRQDISDRFGRDAELGKPDVHLTPPDIRPDIGHASLKKQLDWRRKMSDHIAYALLVYTALQIFVTIGALKAGGESLLPYLALVILVIAIIPACRRFEARWNRLTDEQARDPGLQPWYRRDLIRLWALAIGLPFALTAVFKGLALVLAR